MKGAEIVKNAPELLKAYVASIRDPLAAATLFADDGVLELPYLQSLSIPTGAKGPAAIEQFIGSLLKNVPDFRFNSFQMLIETPDQAFGEYEVEARVVSTGKIYRQMYAGRLVAVQGKIKLLRESLDTVAALNAYRD
jgi:ketosteroid isomerase-like protein